MDESPGVASKLPLSHDRERGPGGEGTPRPPQNVEGASLAARPLLTPES
jgi:hypothetical protein